MVQLVARGTLDPEVPGSKPGAPAILHPLPIVLAEVSLLPLKVVGSIISAGEANGEGKTNFGD